MSEEPQKNLPEKSAAAFHVREGQLSQRLGINRDVLRYLRQQHLQEDVHFARIAKKIHYTTEGADIIRQRLDLSPDELQKLIAAAHEKAAPPEEPLRQRRNADQSGTVTLKVWKSFSFPQPDGSLRYNGVIEAYLPNTDPEVPANRLRVTVRSGANYVRHMEIPARHIAGDVYECTRPDPRWRGSW